VKFIIKKSFIILLFIVIFSVPNNSFSTVKKIDDYGIISIMYHRFDENKYPSTNIQLEQFKKQINLIKDSGFNFINANTFEKNLQNNKLNKKILLTIDDAFLSFYEKAWPILKNEKIPFILFVSTREVGKYNYMTWEQINEIAKEDFVHIGNHSHSHEYLIDMSPDQIIDDIKKSILILKSKVGYNSNFFSYPFGEYSLGFKKIIKELGFHYAFGQHSGVIDETKDFFELPRFPINEKYGEMNRFNLILNSLPLKYRSIFPEERFLQNKNNPPEVNIEFFDDIRNLKLISCYSNEEDTWRKSDIKFIESNKLQINLKGKFTTERGRINCSLRDDSGGWRWLGMQFVIADK